MSVPEHSDNGMSLVEIMVAMTILLVVMAIVTTATIVGFQTVRSARSLSDVQVSQQNALLWTTRLLRYADNPVEGVTPTPWTEQGSVSALPGASSIVFYTYSGTGPLDEVPYRVNLRIDDDGNLRSSVATPQKPSESYEGWCWDTEPVDCAAITPDIRERVLVSGTPDHLPGLTLEFADEEGLVLAVPSASVPADEWQDWTASIDTVTIRIFDQGAPTQAVEQVVRLENPR